uniref:Uncharacterized protein n=1 Tax=Rhizophora mucronata TaxID=61149 RepID=A0A2P2NEF4_RHIMU
MYEGKHDYTELHINKHRIHVHKYHIEYK